MKRYARQPGLTLIELMVAVGILAIIILGIGYIFTQTSRAVNMTQGTIDSNAVARAGSGILRDDMQAMTKEGFLCIVAGWLDPDGNGPKPPEPRGVPALMFTATGHFQTAILPVPANSIRAANAAVITYMPCRDARAPLDADDEPAVCVLGRFVHMLAGVPSDPGTDPYTNLRELIDQNGNATVNDDERQNLLGNDRLRSTLADVRASNAAALLANWVFFPTVEHVTLDSAPMDLDAVTDLWPYLAGGCELVDIEFYDGKAKNGNDLAPGAPMEWFSPATVGLNRPNLSQHPGTGSPLILWTHEDKTNWPRAIRLTLRLRDVSGRVEPQKYEIILNVPR